MAGDTSPQKYRLLIERKAYLLSRIAYNQIQASKLPSKDSMFQLRNLSLSSAPK